MLVICTLIVGILSKDNIPWTTKLETEGRVLRVTEEKYMIDFSRGFKGNRVAGIKNYRKVWINKNDCRNE